MLNADTLREVTTQLPDGRWVAAKPIPAPFWWRVRDAWRVLLGKAEAVSFEGQD